MHQDARSEQAAFECAPLSGTYPALGDASLSPQARALARSSAGACSSALDGGNHPPSSTTGLLLSRPGCSGQDRLLATANAHPLPLLALT